MGINVFLGLCFFFSHARIGLLVEPGRETEKLIIVPLFPEVEKILEIKFSEVRRQIAFEHLIRIFRFLVIQVRCGKQQDTTVIHFISVAIWFW